LSESRALSVCYEVKVMRTVSFTECKAGFEEYIDVVHDEPITIQKAGLPTAVLISYREYKRLIALENACWLKQAKEAEKFGYIGTKKSTKILKTVLGV
jgi:prevent-host-death family protein